MPDEPFDRFMRLSAVLVAKPDLREPVGRAFWALLLQGANGPTGRDGAAWHYTRRDVRTTLDRFGKMRGTPAELERQMRETLLPDPRCTPVLKTIAYIWYSAALPAVGGFPLAMAPSETYEAALVWEAISGVPTGVTGPYHGNWAFPPPRGIRKP